MSGFGRDDFGSRSGDLRNLMGDVVQGVTGEIGGLGRGRRLTSEVHEFDSAFSIHITALDDEEEERRKLAARFLDQLQGSMGGNAMLGREIDLAGARIDTGAGRVDITIPKTAAGGTRERLTRGVPPGPVFSVGAAPEAGAVTRGGAEVGAVTRGGQEIGRAATELAQPSLDAPLPRHLHARLPEMMRQNERTSILVRIILNPEAGPTVALRPIRIPPEGITATLNLHAPGLVIHGPATQQLHVPADSDSGWALFEVEAPRPGTYQLSVTAFADSAYLGELSLEIRAEPGAVATASVDRVQGIDFRLPEEGEVTLEVRYNQSKQAYSFQFQGIGFGVYDEVTSDQLGRTPEEAINELIEFLNQNARDLTGLSTNAARRLLKGKGISLWDEFVPQAFKETFWQHHDAIRRITILSKDDVVPWELLYPSRPGHSNDEGFLAERYPVVRWRNGPSARPALRVVDPAYVLPAGSPPAASKELAEVRRRVGDGPTASTIEELLDYFDAASFGLLHFACHNTFLPGAPAASYIQFGQAQFQPDFLNEYADRFKARAPVIFMNACRTGSMGKNYTKMTGWAAKFLDAGAGAFLGSLWEVRDSTARLFAEAFYDAFKDTTTLGDALQTARHAVSEEPGDPTWLAYTLYGDPAARNIKGNPHA